MIQIKAKKIPIGDNLYEIGYDLIVNKKKLFTIYDDNLESVGLDEIQKLFLSLKLDYKLIEIEEKENGTKKA